MNELDKIILDEVVKKLNKVFPEELQIDKEQFEEFIELIEGEKEMI